MTSCVTEDASPNAGGSRVNLRDTLASNGQVELNERCSVMSLDPITKERKPSASRSPLRRESEREARRRSTFSPTFRGWQGPVLKPGEARLAPNHQHRPTAIRTRRCNRMSTLQTQPGVPSPALLITDDNENYRQDIRNSVRLSRTIPRRRITHRTISVPSISWTDPTRSDSIVSRISAFEWERPNPSGIERPSRCSTLRPSNSPAAAHAPVPATINRQRWRENLSLHDELQRARVDNERTITLVDQIFHLRSHNEDIRREIERIRRGLSNL